MNSYSTIFVTVAAALVSAVALALSQQDRREELDERLESIGNTQAITGRVQRTWQWREAWLASNETATARWNRSYESNDVLSAAAGLDYTLIRTRLYDFVRSEGEVMPPSRWTENAVGEVYAGVGITKDRADEVKRQCAVIKSWLQARQASGASGGASGTGTTE